MKQLLTGVICLFISMAGSAMAMERPAKVSYDPYTKTTTVTGQLHLHNALLDLDKWDYWLSAAISNGIPKNPVLVFSTDTPEWYFFDRAADADGNDLPVIKGNNEVRVGGVHEEFGIQLTPRYLADHRTTGFNIKIMGSRGSRIVVVPPEVITTFETTYLAEVERVGGFRDDLVASQAAIAPTPEQMTQAAVAGAASMAAKGGVGISFVVLPQGLMLVAVAPGSRADQGKLKAGQLITAINGKNIVGLSQIEVQSIIKNSTGTTTFTVLGLGDLTVAP